MQRIETTGGRPDLARIAAAWLVAEFGRPSGRTAEQVAARILAPPNGPQETFVLFDQDRPVGTARLSHDDLASDKGREKNDASSVPHPYGLA